MWMREQQALGVRQLRSGAQSIQRQIALHEAWVADPTSKVHDFAARDERYRVGLVQKWRQDIERQRDQLQIIRGVLRDKESGHG